MKGMQTGPLIITGGLNPVQQMDPNVSSSLVFQGMQYLDTRQLGGVESTPGIPGYKAYAAGWTTPRIVCVDGVPITLSTSRLAAGQAVTAATPMTLVSTAGTGITLNLPIIPFGSAYTAANKVTPAIAIDAGFTTGNTNGTTAVLSGVPAGAWRFFKKGMRIWIASAQTATTPWFGTVAATPAFGATSITLDSIPPTAVTGGQVGSADPWGINVAWPYLMNSPVADVAIPDPAQMIARALSITSNAGSTAQNVVINGYDAWGQPQTETIPFAGGAATTNGKKAFKYITSIVPATTDAGHTMSAGTTDIFGFTVRNTHWEHAEIFWNGAVITASTGWLTSDDTDPATTTTGDTRGTYAVQSASDASKRLLIATNVPLWGAIGSDQLTNKTLFGVTPV